MARGSAKRGRPRKRSGRANLRARNKPPTAAELRRQFEQRTCELEEAQRQQIATSEVLNVMRRSPADAQLVFDAIVESATHLCEAIFSVVYLYRDGRLHVAAMRNFTAEAADQLLRHQELKEPSRSNAGGRCILDCAIVNITDVLADPEYSREFALAGKWRAVLAVPLLHDGEPIGALTVGKAAPVAFSGQQVQLLKTFADQAAMAIENARLFKETREALERQTATADILKVIASSPSDVQPVFDTIADSARRLCGGHTAIVTQVVGDFLHLRASSADSEAGAEKLQATFPIPLSRDRLHGRAALSGEIAFRSDAEEEPDVTPIAKETARARGFRSLIVVPMMRGGVAIGTIGVSRQEAGHFPASFVELLRTFADQAVIAIENARLVAELRERQAELRVTFDNMGDGVVMFDAATRLTAWNRNFQEMLELPEAYLRERPSFADFFRYLADRGEYSADLETQLSRANEDPRQELRFERLRPDGRTVEVRRNAVAGGGFVMIYSDITERKRAEAAVSAARDAAERALRELQTAQDRLIQTEKLASLGQLTAGIAHEIKNPLNFVNNFSALSAELTDELNDLLKRAALTDKMKEEVGELTKLLQDNLQKVVQHGKRADSIVKNMLLHSREGSGEQRSADINALVDESLNLAYHGARAEKSGFNVTLQRDFDPSAGSAELFPQEITRALLNLISNGFYAANKRSGDAEAGFEPTLLATTKSLGHSVEIRIRDNGTGIPSEIKERIFNPFFTTKPAGEGTGLGLSMSHDIIVKQHGGAIRVDTEPGVFTEFIVTLPRTTSVQSPQRSAT